MFVTSKRGKELNVGFIKRFEQRPSGRSSKWEWIAVDSDGENHIVSNRELNGVLEDLRQPVTIVPAPAPVELISMDWRGPDQAGEFKFVGIEKFPIVGWRLQDGGWPEPVAVGCPNPLEEAGTFFVELPDGAFQQVGYEGERFSSLDACKEAALGARRREFEQRRAYSEMLARQECQTSA